MAFNTADELLASLLPDWHQLLQRWSADGSLVAAAQEALMLSGEPPALRDLVTQWAAGDFTGIPPIVLLSSADMNGAMGAYAISTGTIYLNADWLLGASKETINAVLTEELGHHLDAQLNAVDTPGDEGELFSLLVTGINDTNQMQLAQIARENDIGNVIDGSVAIAAEQSAVAPIAIRTQPSVFGTTREWKNYYSFAAVRSDGSVVSWGGFERFSTEVTALTQSGIQASQIYSNWAAFAAITSEGGVITWGPSAYGGDSTGLDFNGGADALKVTSISSTAYAFAAIRNDGSVVTWGDSVLGGYSGNVDLDGLDNDLGVKEVFSTIGAFAAIRDDGSVVTWGDQAYGGDCSGVNLTGTDGTATVTQIYSNTTAFVALLSDGSVSAWGNQAFGGNVSGVDFNGLNDDLAVSDIISNDGAFAALRSDGSVVTWGWQGGGGDSSSVDFDGENNDLYIERIWSSGQGFAALRSDGAVISWGAAFYDTSGLDFNGEHNDLCVKDVFSSYFAFAALLSDGSVATWGHPVYGGDSSAIDFNGPNNNRYVTDIKSTYYAFCALLDNGTVVTWGDPAYGGDSSSVNFIGSDGTRGVEKIFSTSEAFAALLSDGSVVTWGSDNGGGDSYNVDFNGASNDLSVIAFCDPLTDESLHYDRPGTLGAISSSVANYFAEGVTLEAGALTEPDGVAGTIYYKWYNNTEIVQFGSSSIYVVGPVGLGAYRVEAIYVDGTGSTATVSSATQVVDKVNNGDGSLSAVTSSIPGTFQEGIRLTAGSISADPDGNGTIMGYQWYFNDLAITTNGTSSFYDVSKTGFGNYKVTVTYSDSQGYSTTLTSANQSVNKIDNGSAVISIAANGVVGTGLTATIQTPDPDGDGSFSYQWEASSNGTAWNSIAGATSNTFTPTSNELTKQIRVVVTSTDAQGFPATITSNQTSAVTAPPDAIAPTITDIGVHGNSVILTFSEKIQSTGINTSTFSVKVGGTTRTVSASNYDTTTQNKVTLTLSGTAPASSTSLQVLYGSTTVKDLAGNSLANPTNRFADSFFSGASVTSLYVDYTNLTLTGTSAINGTGNAKNNTITGNQANNTINGAGSADVLTGLGGTDTFVYTTLANSLMGSPSGYTFDRITDFAIGQDKIDGPKTVSITQFQRVGAVATLDQAGLQAVLTNTKFVANGAASFTFGTGSTARTFVAMNDGVAGFDVTKDAVVEITGYSGVLTGLSIV